MCCYCGVHLTYLVRVWTPDVFVLASRVDLIIIRTKSGHVVLRITSAGYAPAV